MANIKKVVDLEIEQDLKFQERMWRIQRAGWIIMALLVLLALLGMFGNGLLANARMGTWDPGAIIDYPRYVRNQAEFTLTVHVGPQVIAGNKISLEINGDYLDGLYIEKIVPQPSREAATFQGVVFEFDVRGEAPSSEITFYLRPQAPGSILAQISLADGRSANFRQFIYP